MVSLSEAYQKRCPFVIDYLIDSASRSRRRLMIRLVKGAYWDSEIKRAQMEGLEGYPVYTRKVYTDVSYLACAKKLLGVPNLIYPQFATHNAHTPGGDLQPRRVRTTIRASTSSSVCTAWANRCTSR
ncbi:proline dehydrogenase family protein [Enterobacter hormaechei]|nr:proline dehydrogenase family protein [Enterobacter hormaechei]